MKKIVRILGVTLSLLVLASCSKDDEPDNNLPSVNPSSLSGSYKVTFAGVDTAVDTNKDGFSSQDLLLEGYNSCGFDNTIQISQTTFSVIKNGVSCNADEKNEIYEYKFNADQKILELYENGKVIETLKQIYLLNDNNKKVLEYERYDSVLKQKIYFSLTKI